MVVVGVAVGRCAGRQRQSCVDVVAAHLGVDSFGGCLAHIFCGRRIRSAVVGEAGCLIGRARWLVWPRMVSGLKVCIVVF